MQLLVVLYEALLGSRRVRGTSSVAELVKKHKALLQQQLARHRKTGKAVGYQEKIRLPRYVRVNTVKTSVKDAIAHFERRGWKLRDGKADTADTAGNVINPPKGVMVLDQQVPNLLVFPPGVSLHDDTLVSSGAVILQDRSSCLSAAALAPVPADAVLADACAAPGNKTSHAASLLALAHTQLGADELQGRVLAFERDPKRERMLRKQMQKFGLGQMVKVCGTDFAEAVAHALSGTGCGQAEELRKVTHVLVDPSCSGSGLVAQYWGSASGVQTGESLENAPAESSEYQRVGDFDIAALAAEQAKLVLAAMSLPNARVVVYSTCSVHKQENEDVVEKIVSEAPAGFELVKALPNWPHRGVPHAPAAIAPLVVRAGLEDSTNGFFVARFERKAAQSGRRKRAPASAHKDEEDEEDEEDEDHQDQDPVRANPRPASVDPPAPAASFKGSKRHKASNQTSSQTSQTPLQASPQKLPPRTHSDTGSTRKEKAWQKKEKGSFKEYRPTAPATRPYAIQKALAKANQERAGGEAVAPTAKSAAKPNTAPARNPWAHAIDVD